VESSCEFGIEPSGSMKCWETIEWPNTVEESRPPLWSSGSWLQIQMFRFLVPTVPDVLRSSGSGTGPLSLVSTTEDLLGRKSNGSGLENRETGLRDPSR
jgi:hypothetical protein